MAQARQRAQEPDVNGSGDDGDGEPGREAIGALARQGPGQQPTAEVAQDALTWIMATAKAEQADKPLDLDVNLGTETEPRRVKWVMRLLDGDEIEACGRAATGNRAMRRAAGTNVVNTTEYHLRMVALATIDPDLEAGAQQLGSDFLDPMDARVELLRETVLKRRPGVIDMLAQQLLIEAGYSDDAVKVNGTVVKAAGN